MDKMERDEKLWGSIFGIVAILAAIVEMCINGIDAYGGLQRQLVRWSTAAVR